MNEKYKKYTPEELFDLLSHQTDLPLQGDDDFWFEMINIHLPHFIEKAKELKPTKSGYLIFRELYDVTYKGISSSMRQIFALIRMGQVERLVKMLLDIADPSDEDAKEKLVEAGVDLHARLGTPLAPNAFMVAHGLTPVVSLFLKYGADVNFKGKDGTTALHHATRRGHFQVVKTLLENNADVNAINDQTQSPVHIAVAFDQERILCELLKYDPDLTLKSEGVFTPLSIAVLYTKELMVHQLLLYVKTYNRKIEEQSKSRTGVTTTNADDPSTVLTHKKKLTLTAMGSDFCLDLVIQNRLKISAIRILLDDNVDIRQALIDNALPPGYALPPGNVGVHIFQIIEQFFTNNGVDVNTSPIAKNKEAILALAKNKVLENIERMLLACGAWNQGAFFNIQRIRALVLIVEKNRDISSLQQAFLLRNLLFLLIQHEDEGLLPVYQQRNEQNEEIYQLIEELIDNGPAFRLPEQTSELVLNENNEFSFVIETMKYIPDLFELLLERQDFDVNGNPSNKFSDSLLNTAITENAFTAFTLILERNDVILYPVYLFRALENYNIEYARLLLAHRKMPSLENATTAKELLIALQSGLSINMDAILTNCDRLAHGNTDTNMVNALRNIKAIIRSTVAQLSQGKNSLLFTAPSIHTGTSPIINGNTL